MSDEILQEHIKFIEGHYKKNVHETVSNIGWVRTGTSVTSKMYDTRELVATYWTPDNYYSHEITKLN